MSDIGDSEISKHTPLPEGIKREEMLREAGLLADFLIRGCDKVKKVGLGGSLSREKENPGDIDLVIFVDDRIAQKFFVRGLDRREKGERVYAAQEVAFCLGFDKEMETVWQICLHQVHFPVDFIVVPHDPSEMSAALWAQYSLDPSFLENISKARIFNQETQAFVAGEEIFSKEQQELIKKHSFIRLSHILQNEEVGGNDIDSMQRSHSHQKRIKRKNSG